DRGPARVGHAPRDRASVQHPSAGGLRVPRGHAHRCEGDPSRIWGGGRQADFVLWGRRARASAYRGQGVRIQSAERQLAAAQRLPAGGDPPQGRIPGRSVLGHAGLRYSGARNRGTAQEGPSVSPSRRSRGGRAWLFITPTPPPPLLLTSPLGGSPLLHTPGARLNRLFTYFVGSMAVWNFGVFMLRRAPDEITAVVWEIVIHTGVIVLPAFYYHFVLIFLESTTRHRTSLAVAYVLAIVFSVINLSGSSLFMSGVKSTYWGWAPATGPLYTPFFAYFNFFLIYGLLHLIRVYKGVDSSFRRNRATLILLGTGVSLIGGVIDF